MSGPEASLIPSSLIQVKTTGVAAEASARRIVVYGVTGSGKSTLAARLAHLTGLDWYAVDDLTWEPGWITVPEDEQRNRISRICATEAWVLDTAYGSWRDVALARADLIVGLDYPRWFTLLRLIRRTVRRMVSRSSICNGNVETLRKVISRDSIIGWHFASFARKRARIRRWVVSPELPPVRRLSSTAATDAWLVELGAELERVGTLN